MPTQSLAATKRQGVSRAGDSVANRGQADAERGAGFVAADGIVTKQELSANFWDCSDPYFEIKASILPNHHKIIKTTRLSEFNFLQRFPI
jgi:hypothetical protein